MKGTFWKDGRLVQRSVPVYGEPSWFVFGITWGFTWTVIGVACGLLVVLWK